MAQEPFLEIRVDTDAFHFIQELFRLSEGFRERSPLRIDWVWVHVKGVRFPHYQFQGDAPDIAELTSSDIQALTLPALCAKLPLDRSEPETRCKQGR